MQQKANTNTVQPTNAPISAPTQPAQTPPVTQPAANGPSNAANTTSKPVEESKAALANPPKPTPPVEKTPKKSTTTPPASSTAPAPAPAAPAPAPRAVANVAVTITGGYAFAVMDGNREISAPSKSHELPLQVNGKTLRLVAPDVFLDHTFKVDGGDDNKFEYTAPGLGTLDIRATRGNCKVMIGKKDLGIGPWTPFAAAPGDYRVDLICPDGQNPFEQTTVTQGRKANVRFTAK
jgi:hypothetical protein